MPVFIRPARVVISERGGGGAALAAVVAAAVSAWLVDQVIGALVVAIATGAAVALAGGLVALTLTLRRTGMWTVQLYRPAVLSKAASGLPAIPPPAEQPAAIQAMRTLPAVIPGEVTARADRRI